MSNASDFIIENGVLTKYVGPGGDVVIPEGVSSVGKKAFFKCNELLHITIPEGVAIIEASAFEECRSGNLVVRKYKGSDPDVFVPETIGKATVTKLNDDVFKGKDFIRSIHLPDSINIIGVWAFESCNNLANINIPVGVTEIMWGTFSGCKALAKLYLPDGLTTIGNSAFEDCTSLVELHIPASTIKIEQGSFGSFRNCPKLTIFAPVGSYAEQYAKNNNIPFVAEEVL